jgi:hypothetical protein
MMNEYLVTIEGQKYRVKSASPLSNEQAYQAALGQVQSPVQPMTTEKERVPYSGAAEGIRAFGQGLTLGFGDELEAALRTGSMSGQQYEQMRNQLRAQQASFGEDYPVASTAANIAGGLVVPGGMALRAGAKAPSLLKTTIGGGAVGGAESVGRSETPQGMSENVLKDAALGAGLSLGGGVVGRALRPELDPVAKSLMQQGVRMTPGQALGGVVESFEEVGSGAPIVKSLINPARTSAIKSFDMAAFDKALAPIGQKVPRDGTVREVLSFTRDALGKEYDRIYPQMSLAYNKTLENQMSGLLNRYPKSKLPDAQREFFQNNIMGVVDTLSQGAISGARIKALRQDLRDMALKYKNETGDAGLLYEPLRDLDIAVGKSLQNQNRKLARELAKTDEGYSKFVAIETAVPVGGGVEGIFSPAQLAQSTARADKSIRKGASRRGETELSKFAQEGIERLGSKTPDSGTAGRAAGIGLMTGAASAVDPMAATLTGLGSLAYTDPAMNAFQRFIAAQRPELMQRAGAGLSRAAPFLPSLLYGD